MRLYFDEMIVVACTKCVILTELVAGVTYIFMFPHLSNIMRQVPTLTAVFGLFQSVICQVTAFKLRQSKG